MSLNSLKEAILDLATEMEQEGTSSGDLLLLSYAKQLQRLCKAAGEDPPEGSPTGPLSSLTMESPEAQHRRMVEKYKNEEFKGKVPKIQREEYQEVIDGRMVMVEGTETPLTMTIPTEAPIGFVVGIEGRPYVLREDGKLHKVEQKVEEARIVLPP